MVKATSGITGPTGPTGPPPTPRLAVGISEANPHLFDPGSAAPGFTAYRDELFALRPDYYRLFVEGRLSGEDLAHFERI